MRYIKQLSHNQIRYISLPFLALALVHFISYGLLPWDESYQFPLILFLSTLFICICCCEINTLSYHRLSKRLSLEENPLRTISVQLISSLVLTTLVFAITVYSINYFVFGQIASFSRFLSSLFIALLIISIETLVYIIRDFKNLSINQTPATGKKQILISTYNKTLSIDQEELAYIFSQKGLVYLVKKNGEKLLTQFSSLNELLENHQFDHFFKLNRQFMVSSSAIHEIQKDINQKLQVSLHPTAQNIPSRVTVSRYTSPTFKKWMNQ